MRHRILLGIVACVAALAVACSGSEPSASNADGELINGKLAEAGAFPSTFQIVDNCTVTKVGDRVILTAAHCVRTLTGEIQPGFAKGSSIKVRLRTATGADGGPQETESSVTIARTVIHPRIGHYCATHGCQGRASDERRDAPDLAIIEVVSGLEKVPTASVDLRPALPGDAVTILGYGCTTDTMSADLDGKLRYRETKLVPVGATIHAGGLAADDAVGLASLEANYVFTAGPLANAPAASDAGARKADGGAARATEAGLCPGDSGGALYRKGTNVVVGVNASYTFLPGGWVSVTNWHARVDGKTRWGSAAWLESMGVKLTGACTASTCNRVRSEDEGGPGDGGIEAGTDAGTDAGARDGGR